MVSQLEGWLLFFVVIEAFPTALVLLAMLLSTSQHRRCPKCGYDGKIDSFGYEIRILHSEPKQ